MPDNPTATAAAITNRKLLTDAIAEAIAQISGKRLTEGLGAESPFTVASNICSDEFQVTRIVEVWDGTHQVNTVREWLDDEVETTP